MQTKQSIVLIPILSCLQFCHFYLLLFIIYILLLHISYNLYVLNSCFLKILIHISIKLVYMFSSHQTHFFLRSSWMHCIIDDIYNLELHSSLFFLLYKEQIAREFMISLFMLKAFLHNWWLTHFKEYWN